MPFDRGAHWIHSPDTNPLTKLASRTGLEIYPAPSGQRVRIGQRYARESELEDYLAAVVRANRGIADAARGRTDVDCRAALPKDLGDWRSTVEFALGPYASARDLDEISAQDLSRSVERDIGAFCRQGYGALLAKLAEGIPVELDAPVSQVDFGKGATGVDSDDAEGPPARPLHDRHRFDRRVDVRAHQVRGRIAQAPARCARQAQARQLRPHRAGAHRQSARLAARRRGVREIVRAAHRSAARQYGRHAGFGDRGRRPLRPRPGRQGREGRRRIRRGVAEQDVRRRASSARSGARK